MTNLDPLSVFFFDPDIKDHLTIVILTEAEVAAEVVESHLHATGNVDHFPDLENIRHNSDPKFIIFFLVRF